MKKQVLSILAILIMPSILRAELPKIKTDTLTIQSENLSIQAVLSEPQNSKQPPVALIIGGSGPTDLNGNQPLMQNNSLKFLSNALVNEGIATLRFDKRGVGKSTYPEFKESKLTIVQYAKDVKKLILYMQNKSFSEIYVIGHSEGSLIGLIALQDIDVDGFISIAGAGYSADNLLKKQLKPKLSLSLYNSVELIIDSLKNGNYVKNIPQQLNALFRPSIQPYLISWFNYNPGTLIKDLNCSSLIIKGNKDIQIDMDEAQKLANTTQKAKLVKIANMNHILKTIDGGLQENIQSYTNPELKINSELIEAIVNFINK